MPKPPIRAYSLIEVLVCLSLLSFTAIITLSLLQRLVKTQQHAYSHYHAQQLLDEFIQQQTKPYAQHTLQAAIRRWNQHPPKRLPQAKLSLMHAQPAGLVLQLSWQGIEAGSVRIAWF